jgi:hypothetical protein
LGYCGVSSGVVFLDQYGTTGGSTAFQAGWIIEAGYSSVNGQLLWGPVNRTENVDTRVSFGTTGNGNSGYAIGDGAWVECDLNTLTVTGYNLLTGASLWGPEALPNANQWDSLGMMQIVANGSIYIWGLGGDVYSINILTGVINWQYHTPPGGVDSPYGIEPLWTGSTMGAVADGMLFLPEGHEFSPPLYHGGQQIALNITNGQLVWNILAFDVNGPEAISDGVMTTLNAYDNQIYGYGMGPSKTTVTAPSVGVTTSTPITISGTVTDISAGSQQNAVAMNFPNGLPCVSDTSMTQWMEYVYMQQPMPTNATGVQVTLTAIDPNHNLINIGTATTDTSGNYGFIWTPPQIPGPYQITATFSGTNSYYSSSDTTYMNLQASATTAPTATPASNLATTSDLTLGIAVAVIAMIIAIAIVGLLIIRKKP